MFSRKDMTSLSWSGRCVLVCRSRHHALQRHSWSHHLVPKRKSTLLGLPAAPAPPTSAWRISIHLWAPTRTTLLLLAGRGQSRTLTHTLRLTCLELSGRRTTTSRRSHWTHTTSGAWKARGHWQEASVRWGQSPLVGTLTAAVRRKGTTAGLSATGCHSGAQSLGFWATCTTDLS